MSTLVLKVQLLRRSIFCYPFKDMGFGEGLHGTYEDVACVPRKPGTTIDTYSRTDMI
jgi:hypothetical protein